MSHVEGSIAQHTERCRRRATVAVTCSPSRRCPQSLPGRCRPWARPSDLQRRFAASRWTRLGFMPQPDAIARMGAQPGHSGSASDGRPALGTTAAVHGRGLPPAPTQLPAPKYPPALLPQWPLPPEPVADVQGGPRWPCCRAARHKNKLLAGGVTWAARWQGPCGAALPGRLSGKQIKSKCSRVKAAWQLLHS